jgi:NitT/TauT family transport system substrate-binding protein
VLPAVAALCLLFQAGAASAATDLRIAQQFGISYLPLIVAKEKKLIEARAVAGGITDLKIDWLLMSGGNAMNEGLISGSLDIASAGAPPMITLWSRTKGSLNVKGIAALGSIPNELNTSNPNIKTLKDFGKADKIALPAPKVGFQAIVLQMAAEQAFGEGQFARLDDLTVGLSHPDATAALLAGNSGVTGHFTSPPFQQLQRRDPKIHRVLSSYDVLGGPHTFNVIYATSKFRDGNPKLVRAIVEALDEAAAFITADPKAAAALYVGAEKSPLNAEEVEALIRDPQNRFTTTPESVMKFANFQKKVGQIPEAPASWTDLFFPELHDKKGN